MERSSWVSAGTKSTLVTSTLSLLEMDLNKHLHFEGCAVKVTTDTRTGIQVPRLLGLHHTNTQAWGHPECSSKALAKDQAVLLERG